MMMTKTEVNRLIKLLTKFRLSTDKEGEEMPPHENAIVRTVGQWVFEYGRFELGMDPTETKPE